MLSGPFFTAASSLYGAQMGIPADDKGKLMLLARGQPQAFA